MIKKILVAVAGRGLCEQMVNMLLELPSFQQASFTILHVVPSQVTSDAMSEKLEEGGKFLAEAVKSIKAAPERITARLKQGEPKDIVLQVADEEDVDLIIMGSRALGRLQAILENSVSQYVFQLSSRPMLLVKDDVYVKQLRRIVVAADNSPDGKESLKTALILASDSKNSELTLAHADSSKKYDPPETDPVLADAATEARKYGVKYRCTSVKGRPGPEICKIAADANADLMILGSPDRRPTIAKGLPDLDRLLGESLSDYVRVHAGCPVLMIRSSL